LRLGIEVVDIVVDEVIIEVDVVVDVVVVPAAFVLM